MDTVNTINSQVGLKTAQISMEYYARVLNMRKSVMQQQGDMAIKLIQSAVLPPTQGQNLDVKV